MIKVRFAGENTDFEVVSDKTTEEFLFDKSNTPYSIMGFIECSKATAELTRGYDIIEDDIEKYYTYITIFSFRVHQRAYDSMYEFKDYDLEMEILEMIDEDFCKVRVKGDSCCVRRVFRSIDENGIGEVEIVLLVRWSYFGESAYVSNLDLIKDWRGFRGNYGLVK